MPITTGARRGDYLEISGSETLSYVTVATLTDTEANRNSPESKIPPGELNFITSISYLLEISIIYFFYYFFVTIRLESS